MGRPRFAFAFALATLAFVGGGACAGARYDRNDGPAVTMPARFAEGTPRGDEDGGAERGDAGPPLTKAKDVGRPPDPEALRLARQWEYELTYESGAVRVTQVTLRTFPKPVVTQRNMGRWAIELWIGRELVERVRFDFPLLRAEEPRLDRRRPLHEPPTFAAGAVMKQTILVPASPRATRALIVDRATGEETELPWPPDAPLPPPREALPPKVAKTPSKSPSPPAPDAGAPLMADASAAPAP